MKKILFDLDGTLTDSGEGILNCAAATLRHFGLPLPDRAQMRSIVGPPLRDSLLRYGVDAADLDAAIRIYRERYMAVGRFENTPYPGIRKLLADLRSSQHRLYVATSKPEDMSVEILKHFDLAVFFDIVAGASSDGTRSTKGQVITHLLEQLEDTGSLVMVGDTVYDVLGAAEHGIPCIGVAWGYGSAADMLSAGAAAIAHDTDELYTLLTQA